MATPTEAPPPDGEACEPPSNLIAVIRGAHSDGLAATGDPEHPADNLELDEGRSGGTLGGPPQRLPRSGFVQQEISADGLEGFDPSPEQIYDRVLEMLHTVYDPEIPVDIYELGLVYGIDVLPDLRVQVRMTLTSPSCPSAQQIPEEVKAKVEMVDGVVAADVEIVWEPPWSPMMMSEEARLELNV